MREPAIKQTDRLANNFGALRLLFAILVILSHSSELIDGDRSREILTRIFGTLSFGELGVDGFFLISGYLITKSFQQSRSMGEYLLKRVLRIYPGYLAAYLVCVFVLGPFVGAQIARLSGLRVLAEVLTLHGPAVPGVFAGSPYPVLNGSMWTIAYEFRCYALLLVAGFAGLHLRPFILALVTAGLMALAALHPNIFDWVPKDVEGLLGVPNVSARFISIFGCGALFYLYRDRIWYDGRIAAAAGVVWVGLMFSPLLAEPAVAVLGGYVLFWFAFNVKAPRLAAIGRKTDLSYGAYLYAWPIQKVLIWTMPGISPWSVFVEASAAACVLAFASWWLVEKPFLGLKPPVRPAPSETGIIRRHGLSGVMTVSPGPFRRPD